MIQNMMLFQLVVWTQFRRDVSNPGPLPQIGDWLFNRRRDSSWCLDSGTALRTSRSIDGAPSTAGPGNLNTNSEKLTTVLRLLSEGLVVKET